MLITEDYCSVLLENNFFSFSTV